MTEHLTAREREVCAQMMAGASTAAIADQLGISERTVQNYINNIIAKLGVSNRTEAVVQLYQTQQIAINA
jgi:two-component system response regulator DegU